MKKVLVACEESQRVAIEFRKLGFEAYSCDLDSCSGGHPEWHIQSDVVSLLNGSCAFKTADNVLHETAGRWDLIIAFPPCTYLTAAGNRWFDVGRYGDKALERRQKRKQAVEFFMKFVYADCGRVAIENPVGIMSSVYRKPNCIIQPWMFGDNARKTTCLWLKGLPRLVPDNIVNPGEILSGGYSVNASANWAVKDGKILSWNDPETAKIRSKTYHGVARAMALQWSFYI